jgi:hypothetical protein
MARERELNKINWEIFIFKKRSLRITQYLKRIMIIAANLSTMKILHKMLYINLTDYSITFIFTL